MLRTLTMAAILSSLPLLPLRAEESSPLSRTVGTVVGVNGNVSVVQSGGSAKAARGYRLVPGDRLKTEEDGKIKVLFDDDSILAVGPRSEVEIRPLTLTSQQRRLDIKVIVGRFKLAVSKFFGPKTYAEVRTPTSVMGVRGTVLWGDTELDAACSLDGSVLLAPIDDVSKVEKLSAGQCRAEMGQGKLTEISPKPEDVARYLDEVTLKPE